MTINIRRILLSLSLTLAALSLPPQAMAMKWQALFRWVAGSGSRNIYLMVNVPALGTGANTASHMVATNLYPAPVSSYPANLQFYFFPLQGGNAQLPLSVTQLQTVPQPELSVTLNTENCQTIVHSVSGDTTTPYPQLHVEEETLHALGSPNLILANYLFPGCMLQSLLAGKVPAVHNSLSLFHSLLNPGNQSRSPWRPVIPSEQLLYAGEVVPRANRYRLLGPEKPLSFTIHPFIPRGSESLITPQAPGVQVFQNRFGIGRIASTNAMFASQGIVIITVSNQHIMIASNGQGGVIALVPVTLAVSWQWLPDDFLKQYSRRTYRRDRDDFDPAGGGSDSAPTFVR